MFSPVTNGIFFVFIDDTANDRFVNSTSSGIAISNTDKNQLCPRWARVIAVGPDVVDVLPDQFVLVDTGKWTEGIPFGNTKFWKTSEEHIILISDTPQTTY